MSVLSEPIFPVPIVMDAERLLYSLKWIAFDKSTMASWSLGKWAIPSVHDPGDFLIGLPLYLHAISMCLSFAVAPLAIAFGHWRGTLSLHAFAYSAFPLGPIPIHALDC